VNATLGRTLTLSYGRAMNQAPTMRLPKNSELGPDPEDCTLRFERMAAGLERGPAPDAFPSAPSRCTLMAAAGRDERCPGHTCVFYRVPDVPAECALDVWAPRFAEHPRQVAWFLARRAEAEGRADGEDASLRGALREPTPGPAAALSPPGRRGGAPRRLP
jgi:hypothetical protein